MPPQNILNEIKSALFRLNSNDFVKGLEMFVLASILGAFQQAFTVYGFSVSMYDWRSIEMVAAGAAITYLVKNFSTASNGKLFGKI